MLHVSRVRYHTSCPMFHVSCLTSHLSCLMLQISCFMFKASLPCFTFQTSNIICKLYLKSHTSHLRLYVSSFLSHVFKLHLYISYCLHLKVDSSEIIFYINTYFVRRNKLDALLWLFAKAYRLKRWNKIRLTLNPMTDPSTSNCV